MSNGLRMDPVQLKTVNKAPLKENVVQHFNAENMGEIDYVQNDSIAYDSDEVDQNLEWLQDEINIPPKAKMYPNSYEKLHFYDDCGLVFGTNQASLHNEAFSGNISDELKQIVRQYFPDLTDYEIYILLSNTEYAKGGSAAGLMDMQGLCDYTSITNALLEYFNGKEDLFEQTFGYPMYGDNGNFNSKLLLCDFYCFTNQDIFSKENSFTGKHPLTSDTRLDKDPFVVVDDAIQRFLASKGLNVSSQTTVIHHEYQSKPDPNLMQEIESAMKDNTLILNAYPSAYYGTDKYTLDLPMTNVYGDTVLLDEAHAMTIAGIYDENHLIVDSWGDEYVIDIRDFEDKCIEIEKIHIE